MASSGASGQGFSHFQILEKIGQGGMGEVYLARDTKLRRKVALKFLPMNLRQDEGARKRLVREARSAASLDHPYICKIYEIGESEDRLFIAMEYVEGQTLKQKLCEARLSLSEGLTVAAEIAEALEKAHRVGILHRDLKPANIMLTSEGHVKVLDFGLAKQVARAEAFGDQEETRSAGLTATGMTVGTPAYMSPEQLRGRQLDSRSDIFALGMILYEIICSVHPFREDQVLETASAILNKTPEPLVRYRPEAPNLLQHLMTKMLAKRRQDRYQTVHEVATDLRAVLLALSEASTTRLLRSGKPAWLLAFALLVVLVASWWSLYQPESRESTRIASLAVLPLDNHMNDPDQEYFVDGMTEALIASLARISALRVTSRTSVMRYKETEKSLPEIADELGVDAILEGSVLREGNQVRITTQLIDATSDSHLWAHSYDRELSGILQLHSEVARAIAAQVEVALTPREENLLSAFSSVDPEAFDLYTRGRRYYFQLTAADVQKSIDYYRRSIEKSPGFALAYAALSTSYAWLGHGIGDLTPAEAFSEAKRYALKALELDEALAEAHIAVAHIQSDYEWDWNLAERAFQRGIELNPSLSEGRSLYTHHLISQGRFDEGIAEARRARQIDPLKPLAAIDLAGALLYSGRYKAAEDEYSSMSAEMKSHPWYPWGMGMLCSQQGRHEEAIEWLEKSRGLATANTLMLGTLGAAYGRAGETELAQQILEQLEQLRERRYASPTALALVNLGLGRNEQALDWLEEGYRGRETWMKFLAVWPWWEPLRDHSRYRDLVGRMGLD